MPDRYLRELAKLAGRPAYNPTVHALLAVDYRGRFSFAVEYPAEWRLVEARVADHSLATEISVTRRRHFSTMVAAGRHEVGIYCAVKASRHFGVRLAGVEIDFAPDARVLVTITPKHSRMSRPIEEATLAVTSLSTAPLGAVAEPVDPDGAGESD
jgi:hypothetical protein